MNNGSIGTGDWLVFCFDWDLERTTPFHTFYWTRQNRWEREDWARAHFLDEVAKMKTDLKWLGVALYHQGTLIQKEGEDYPLPLVVA